MTTSQTILTYSPVVLKPQLGPYDLGRIYPGDARELAGAIPADSVDMIFADPEYDQIDDYAWLAQLAARVLKPDRACLAYCSDVKIGQVIAAMSPYLKFIKPMYYTVKAKPACLRGYNVFTWTTPCVWFAKGKGFPHKRTIDTIISSGQPQGGHKWNKNPEAYARWIADFTRPGDVVLDPFTGSGTVPLAAEGLNRAWLAFEHDPAAVELARQRLASRQTTLDEVAA